jgi:hypothetical protein
MPNEIIEYYERFLGEHAWLEVAMCWTVIEPVTADLDLAEVVRRLGGDPDDLSPRGPREHVAVDLGRECVFFLDQVDRAVTIMEVNGYQGARPEVLRRLSDGARVHSAFWNVNANNRLSFAAFGEVVTDLEADYPDERNGTDPDALNEDLGDLIAMAPTDESDGGNWRAGMLAVVEARTGVRLDLAWPARPHPTIVLPAITEAAGRSTVVGRGR